MMKKRMLGVIAVLLVCIFALSACKKEAGKPVDNAVSENTTDDSEDTDQTEDVQVWVLCDRYAESIFYNIGRSCTTDRRKRRMYHGGKRSGI